jgi:phosphinothricin acetyltransferase
MVIRPATIDDLPLITDIYNDAIRTTVATFDTEPKSLDEQKSWLEAHGTHYPVVVAESDGAVIGWASLSRYSDRCAYSDTAEASVYVAKQHRHKGIGGKLLSELMERGAEANLHVVIARIAGGNEISVHLFETHGFEHVGVLKEVGRKFGKLVDVHIMQRLLN